MTMENKSNLLEVKSISDDVVDISDVITDRILADAPKRLKKISRVNKAVYDESFKKAHDFRRGMN